jgi:hypothetical protein
MFKTHFHFSKNWFHDITLSLLSIRHQIALVFYFSSEIWLVQLVAHTIVAFDKGNSQVSRSKFLLRILGRVTSILYCLYMRGNCGVGSNAVAVHERNELRFGQQTRRDCSTILKRKRRWRDPTSNFQRRQLSLASRPTLPWSVDLQPIPFHNHQSLCGKLF